MMQDCVEATAEPGSTLTLFVDRSLAKQFLLIWWLSALISGAALIGLLVTVMFIRTNISYTAVLEYDLMDLRSKMGLAHENTPPPEEAE